MVGSVDGRRDHLPLPRQPFSLEDGTAVSRAGDHGPLEAIEIVVDGEHVVDSPERRHPRRVGRHGRPSGRELTSPSRAPHERPSGARRRGARGGRRRLRVVVAVRRRKIGTTAARTTRRRACSGDVPAVDPSRHGDAATTAESDGRSSSACRRTDAGAEGSARRPRRPGRAPAGARSLRRRRRRRTCPRRRTAGSCTGPSRCSRSPAASAGRRRSHRHRARTDVHGRPRWSPDQVSAVARRVDAWPTRRPTAPLPGRSRRRRASTGSATPRAGSSTSARPRTSASRLSSYFQDIGEPARAHRHDGHHRGERRVDRRRDRGRGAPAGVLLDQGVRPALQREVPRRQVLPVARGDGRRGVPAGHGGPRGEEEGHPLLRPLLATPGRSARPSTSCCGSSRCAPAQQRRLQALRPDRPALPARLHRQVRGAVRRPGQRRGAPRDRRRLLRLHGRPAPARSSSALEREMYAASDGPRLREGGPAARRPRRPQPGAGEAGGRARRRHRRRRHRLRRGPARGRGADLPRARRPDPRPARLGRRPDRRRRHRRAVERLPPAALRRRVGDGDPARDPGAGRCRPTTLDPRAAGSPSCAAAGWRSGCRSAATSSRCRRPSPATPASRWRSTRPSAPAT